jgi:hypothetical protein
MYRKPRITLLAATLSTLTFIFANAPISLADEPPASNEAPPAEEAKEIERTPPRLSFIDGQGSFWRPGTENWVPAQINTPLAPGDELYSGGRANLELQIGARAYMRAGEGTQIGLENQEPDFLQFKVTAGHASFDLRSMAAGHALELDTPNAAFTIERTGYYRVDVSDASTTFISRRGGRASMVPAGGEAVGIAPSEEVVIQGTDDPRVETYVAPEIDAWDHWNYERTDHLIDPLSARYVSSGVYGADALDHYGTWRVVQPYGPVWVPEDVPAGWAPYSIGRWIWDPYYSWTWVDTAPWGWAPYHYGRWVYADGYWAWAPGPAVVAPVYAPALVAFFGGTQFGVSISVGVPGISWVALGWGEPCIPWWGRAGFIGRPWWGGWGGPRIVNNVVINKTSVVNINNITYYNVGVHDAVIGVPKDRFGHHLARHVHLSEADVGRLEPVRGPLSVKPVAASLVPTSGHALRPPPAVLSRNVVATRAPHDPAPGLRAQGLNAPAKMAAPAPRVVAAPRGPNAAFVSPRPPFGRQGAVERPRPAEPPRFGEQTAAPRVAPHGPPAQTGRVPAGPAVTEHRVPARQARGELPGEPANRLYRGGPQSQPPRTEAQQRPVREARPERAPAREQRPR